MATAKTGMPTEEINDVIYLYTYRVLRRVALLIPASIKPNQISFLAFFCSMTSCVFLYFISSPAAFLYWIFFNTLWYVFDTLDGMHARITDQTSEFGGFLDHFFDNVYFLFMFSVFIVKFHLLHPFYIFIILMRFTICTVVFLVQNHTGKMYLSKFSGGGEFLLMTGVMLLSYALPHFNLLPYITSPILLKAAVWLSLDSGVFMKLILIFYLIGMLPSFVAQYLFARRELCSNES